MKQAKLDQVFINVAKEVASLSYCVRSKVGAVLVRDGNIISFGYNGTPSGMDNSCEENDKTLPHTIHAEVNAILKAAKCGNSVDNSTLYLTLSPCLECSKLILQSGIKRVVYSKDYRNLEGLNFISQFIKVEKHE
jgi:dCMP deaminase